jgi:hypothetical protein
MSVKRGLAILWMIFGIFIASEAVVVSSSNLSFACANEEIIFF